jgi:hypothetical protein
MSNWIQACRNLNAFAIVRPGVNGVYIGSTLHTYTGSVLPVQEIVEGDDTNRAMNFDAVTGFIDAGDWIDIANWDDGFTFIYLYSGYGVTTKLAPMGSTGATNTVQMLINGASSGSTRVHVQNNGSQKNRADCSIGTALYDDQLHCLCWSMSGGAGGDNTARCVFDGVDQTSNITYTYQAMSSANWDTPTRDMAIGAEMAASAQKFYKGNMSRLVHFHNYLTVKEMIHLSQEMLATPIKGERGVNRITGPSVRI